MSDWDHEAQIDRCDFLNTLCNDVPWKALGLPIVELAVDGPVIRAPDGSLWVIEPRPYEPPSVAEVVETEKGSFLRMSDGSLTFPMPGSGVLPFPAPTPVR